MRQQKSKSNSILLQVFSGLLKVGGCLLLAYIGLIAFFTLFVMPLFFSFGIRDKQVEILLGLSASMVTNSKQVEGKQFVGSMNKGQLAYLAENSVLGNSIAALGLGIKTETNDYKYSTRATQTAAFNYAVSKNKTLKNYVGGVFLVPAQKLDPNGRRDEMMTITILCETEKRPFFRVKQADEPDEPAEPIYQNGEVICGKGTTQK
ncbi:MULTISPECIES: type IV pilin-like G/H family protein [unclassified Microcoleus]|uniref:type IV pilin-like G/H family protein n=1 Tax=unclassified Microcoleus TaxID=2642155 RepID=UPI002FD4931F